MAKTPNGLGQYSGKVGGVVYAVQNGQQIVRSYQPVVSNPKSALQRQQRAKANLVGRVSQITPWQILQGLGANRRARRSRFLSLAMRAAQVVSSQTNPEGYVAKLPPASYVFSEGVAERTMGISDLTAAARLASVSISRTTGVTDEQYLASGSLVVCVVTAVSGIEEFVFYRFVTPADITGGSLVLNFPHSIVGGYDAAFYLAPFSTENGASLSVLGGELIGEGAVLSAALYVNPNAIPLQWGRSVYNGAAEFRPV